MIVSELQRYIIVCPWPILVATRNHIYLVVIIGNLKFGAYFEVLYPFWLVDNFRIWKVYHCLPRSPLVASSNH